MARLKTNYLVQKRNVLNELRSNSMTLQELRFLSIYLSKINSRDADTRRVRFSMDDFKSIMELGRIDMQYMKNVTNSLLSKVVNIPNERGGYIGFQLFKECEVSKDDYGEWFVEIDVHDRALPLMFEFKNKYFTYQLWNALRLKSPNQLRMYEILKQYQIMGYRVLKIKDLRELLGIEKSEHPRYNNFKTRVLDACQEALYEHTDIKFTYESYGKKGPGGKILQLKFTIEKNEKYSDPLSLEEFIDINKAAGTDENIDIWDMDEDDIDPSNLSKYEARLIFLRGAVAGEFTKEQLTVLCDLMAEHVPHVFNDDTKCYDHLQRKYNMLKLKASQGEIRHRFGYLKSIIGVD
ncbi:MAG: replication initiation protein [Defluviitaleaceae bacterium]|nr:replication initiation protein [Defluviitaleaceae bacterium]